MFCTEVMFTLSMKNIRCFTFKRNNAINSGHFVSLQSPRTAHNLLLFLSELCYGITVWSGIWGPQIGDSMKTSISKKDMRRLQSLQNKTLRLQSGLNRYTPTETLMSATNSLSVHQLARVCTVTFKHLPQPLRSHI